MSYIDLSLKENNVKLKTQDSGDGVSEMLYVSISGASTITEPLETVSTPLTTGVYSGQITVTASGTAVQGTSNTWSAFYIKAHPDNSDTVWVGNDGANDVTNLNGFPLNPGEVIYVPVSNLNQLWFDSDVSGLKVCWHRG